MKKIAVYLEADDWRSVIALLYSHIENVPALGKPVWQVGMHRIRYIAGEIAAKLPTSKDTAAP